MKISIITAVLNRRHYVESCIRSVLGQSCPPAEYLIQDGSSTDGTLEVIEGFRDSGISVVSAPDEGMYDALNKAIGRATGDVIGILHADDMYADRDVLGKVATAFEDACVDSCYGDLVYVDKDDASRIIRYWRAGPYRAGRFLQGWMPPHPAFFVRRTVYEKYGLFSPEMGTAADYELMLRCLFKYRVSTAYIPEVLVKMRTGGISNASFSKRLRAHSMDRKAWEVNGLRPRPWTLLMKPLSKIPQYWQRP